MRRPYPIILTAIVSTLLVSCGRDPEPETTENGGNGENGDVRPDAPPTTPWGTQISNGMDAELPGTWVLARQLVETSGRSLTHPFTGRTLTITGDGSFVENYATESHIDPNLQPNFRVSGRSGGKMRVEAPTAPASGPELLIRRDSGIGPARQIEQNGELRTSAASFPLGAGRPVNYSDGPWVKCGYELIPDDEANHNQLRVTTVLGAKITWIFRRRSAPPLAIEQTLPGETEILSAAVMNQIAEGQSPAGEGAVAGLGVGFFVQVDYAIDDLSWLLWVNDQTTVGNLKERLNVLPPDREELLHGETPQPDVRTMQELGLEFPQDDPGKPEGYFILVEGGVP